MTDIKIKTFGQTYDIPRDVIKTVVEVLPYLSPPLNDEITKYNVALTPSQFEEFINKSVVVEVVEPEIFKLDELRKLVNILSRSDCCHTPKVELFVDKCIEEATRKSLPDIRHALSAVVLKQSDTLIKLSAGDAFDTFLALSIPIGRSMIKKAIH